MCKCVSMCTNVVYMYMLQTSYNIIVNLVYKLAINQI